MPRRRPPGAGPGVGSTATLLAVLLVLPFITLSTAAQQQHKPHNNPQSPSLPQQHNLDRAANDPKRGRDAYTPLFASNVRAVQTEVFSAPADEAVRAPAARNAAFSGALSPKSARSLKDWEVEDLVLLATIDGKLHARDRYDGRELWALDVGQPMLETIWNKNASDRGSPTNPPFEWIVEPSEDGPLFILTPGPQPVLRSLGMTVKQLSEELAPYATTEPPVVYLADKKNVMLVVDARTGTVTKSFSTAGGRVINGESCSVETAPDYFERSSRECKGLFHIGRTEYTVSIQNQSTGENVCTIKYSEWVPNNRDSDLHAQYQKTMDDQYIYSRFDGHVIALSHNRPKPAKRPVFEHRLDSPVARVFDVARPFDDDDPEAALVLLPQPALPTGPNIEEKEKHVWLNTTEEGSWYALSEVHYPAVTDQAPPALCYTQEWSNHELLNIDNPHLLPDRSGLVGVHILDHVGQAKTVLQIDAPSPIETPIVPIPELPARGSYESDGRLPETSTMDPTPRHRLRTDAWLSLISGAVMILVMLYVGSMGVVKSARLGQLRKKLTTLFPNAGQIPWISNLYHSETPSIVTVPNQQQEAQVKEHGEDPSREDITTADVKSEQVVNIDVAPEKKVRFQVTEEEEEDLEPLSRTTTFEPPVDGDSQSNTSSEPGQATAEQPAGPGTPKKKTHRGKRGGKKKKKADERDTNDENAEQIIADSITAAKSLEQEPKLHPDEVSMTKADDVSDVKRIGKLTINFDRQLGQGSGGTCVYMGKWNERDVAVKRMLSAYTGLAEQEVKLLQESDLHPNVIRYFDDEKDESFLYIALELCQASLFDLYRDGRPADELSESQRELFNQINTDVPKALYQLALGVNHLHSLRIIHRDIKPQNILIAQPTRNQRNGPRLVISDFGLCKTLPDNASTLHGATGNAGTVGWKAPELILTPKEMDRGSSTGHSRDSSSSTDPVAQGVKRAVDIFSLGCVFFYVLTNGCHPFDDEEGWMQIRELNIKKNKINLDKLALGDDSEEPRHLISWMLENRPEYRPTALQVMNHPFFWSAEKRLQFLCDCSDHWERECRDPPSNHLQILESYSSVVIGDKKPDFLAKLNRSFVASLGKQRKYTGDRMLDLLRALRNKRNHYEDMDDSVKALVGPLPHGYLRYWTVKFPMLLISCYDVVVECGLQRESRFRPYFEM